MPEHPPIAFAYPHREHEARQADLEDAAIRVLRSGHYILGSEVQAFEQALADFTAARHAVAVSCGTDALACALIALGVGPGHDVIVPAFGFVAAAGAVVRTGARPVFVDIEPRTLGSDPRAVARAAGPDTRAVLVMHLFGQVADIPAVQRAVPDVPVIEDAAQAMGARIGGEHVGLAGSAGAFSFFPAKSLGAAGDAGAVVTRDAGIADRLRCARAHGASRGYGWEGLGGNYRMDALQAALLRVKLDALAPRLLRRRQIGQTLAEVAQRHGKQVFDGASGCEPVYAPFALRTSGRDGALERLRSLGIDARVHYPATLPGSPAFGAHDPKAWPEAERATRELISVPCCPELTDAEVVRLASALDEVLRG